MLYFSILSHHVSGIYLALNVTFCFLSSLNFNLLEAFDKTFGSNSILCYTETFDA